MKKVSIKIHSVNKNQRILLLLTVLSAVLAAFLFSSCEIDSPYIDEIADKIEADEQADMEYSVVYYGNGESSGTVPFDSTSYHQGDTVEVLDNTGTLDRTNYTFDGWDTSADGDGTRRDPGDTFLMGTSDVALYARWTINTPTVTFLSQGGSTPSPETKVVTYGETYGTLASTSRTGYTFSGWYDASSSGTEITSSSTVTKNIDHYLYAYWTANTYTLYFDEEGGSTVSNKSVTYNSTYGTLPVSTRSGYTFGGWWTGDNGTGSQVTSSTSVTTASDHTLYAKWTANSYTLYFDEEGGSLVSNKIVTYGSPYGTLPVSSRTGYTFDGWWTGDNGTGSEVLSSTIVTTAANHTVYAKWNINSYTLTYSANNAVSGSVPTGSVIYDYGEQVTVLANTGNLARIPAAGTAEAFKFAGWNTKADGTGTAYTAGNTFNMGASNITLYAEWVPFVLRDTGPSGGLIFYDKGSFSSGWRYLEAASSDFSEGYIWTSGGDTQTTAIGTTSTAYGAGYENSLAIVGQTGHYDSAAQFCLDTSSGGFDDWYLPSEYEVKGLYNNLFSQGAGGMDSVYYQSSTESSATGFRAMRFDYGSWYGLSKGTNSCNVRAVRRF